MTTNFGAKEMVDLVIRHTDCEVREDWDGCMATMSAAPYYLHYPLGLRVNGRDAVLEQWKRMTAAAEFGDAAASWTVRHWVVDESVIVVFEWNVDDGDGQTRKKCSFAVFRFADGLIESETIFGDSDVDALTRKAPIPHQHREPNQRRAMGRALTYLMR
ncbi:MULTISPECIES: nuclear transport factor 2 family protein [unclassified Mycobacterium]|uniref:nuclear transport factor 2 family protein n=1 Tax=unclassified Mycobacterium TaxID=2642494 RepID=UPI0029C6530F|nr:MULTISPECIES: nuclear transport factor 2 family protein [unclassified Mycobacterium]